MTFRPLQTAWLAVALVLSSVSVTHADNAPMWESPEGLTPGAPNVTVRMAAEQVDINVLEQNGKPMAAVTATFDMANDGPSATVLTGFPNYAYSALTGSDYDPVTFTPEKLTNFKAWTDTTTYSPKSQRIVPAGQQYGDDWFVWSMDYPQGKTIPVHVAYQQQLDPRYNAGWTPVSYVLRTGALWNGPIGKATITMTADHGALLDGDPAPQQQGDGKLTWTFENFKPTQDVNAIYVGADAWSKLQAARKAATAPGASSSDLVASASSVLDVVVSSDRSSYLGSLYRVPKSLVDTYFVPARDWARAATDVDPSNASAWELVGDMAIIASQGKGEGPPSCWSSEAVNAYQQASGLGSPTADEKLNLLNQSVAQFGLTQDDLPDCGSTIRT